MSFDFPLGGMLVANTIKIICFSMDQIKQVSASAILVDLIQLFFCVCYACRVIFLKILKYNEPEIEGYSKGCSICTDLMVIVSFLLKFYFSQQTNYHDLDAILNDNFEGNDQE